MRVRSPFVAMGLMLGAAAQAQAPDSADNEQAAVADLVLGADTCSKGARRETAMHERIEAAGWTREVGQPLTLEYSSGRTSAAGITMFRHNGARLTYFHSQPMKSCIVSAHYPEPYDPTALLAALTAHLGKEPKADVPGRRYLYGLPGLKILTVQIKPSDGQAEVELSVIH